MQIEEQDYDWDKQDFQDLTEQCAQQTQTAKQNQSKSVIRFREQFITYRAQISTGENLIDMNILQKQYYLITIYNLNQIVRKQIKRRYSDFDILFQALFRKYQGFILPAFPQNGIISYVKTKVTVAKDYQFTNNRIKIIKRFLTKILNQPEFHIDKCDQVRKFFSDEQFSMFKTKQKQRNSNNLIGSTWGIMKGYFSKSSSSKYQQIRQQIYSEKKLFQTLHIKSRKILQLIHQQIQLNSQLSKKSLSPTLLPSSPILNKLLQQYNTQLRLLESRLEELDFNLFCQNQDYMMMLRRITYYQELRNNQNNYVNLRQIQKDFQDKRKIVKESKAGSIAKFSKQYQDLLVELRSIQTQK